MIFAAVILATVFAILLAVLPIWPFSREWGYTPAVLVGLVFLVLLAMTFAGHVPGLRHRSSVHQRRTAFTTFITIMGTVLAHDAQQLSTRVADAANGIENFFAKVGNFGRVNTNELCVDDVCVTRDDFLRMKEGSISSRRCSERGD